MFIWEGWLARFPRSRFFQPGSKFCHMNTSSQLPGWTAGRILTVRMVSSCIACCILHIISIPFNCSDTALRVTDAKIGPKVKMFVFRYVALFPKFGARTRTQDLWPFLIWETGLKFLIWTQDKIHPGNRASPVNRAHTKRPLRLPLIYSAACGFASRHSRLWVSLERKITDCSQSRNGRG